MISWYLLVFDQLWYNNHSSNDHDGKIFVMLAHWLVLSLPGAKKGFSTPIFHGWGSDFWWDTLGIVQIYVTAMISWKWRRTKKTTPPKPTMSPKNWWLGDYFPFEMVPFQGTWYFFVFFVGVTSTKDHWNTLNSLLVHQASQKKSPPLALPK